MDKPKFDPPPGLAFKSDAEGELHFPVGKHDAEKIKTRATTSQQNQWDVAGDLVELCNPRWHAFVTECFEAKRESLGISAAATIELSLNKMVLLEAGARLQVRLDEEKPCDGVFGSLVVTLPGAFKGGNLVYQSPSPDPAQQDELQAKEKTPTWRPATRKTAYDLTYAAFYHHCACEMKPITSGLPLAGAGHHGRAHATEVLERTRDALELRLVEIRRDDRFALAGLARHSRQLSLWKWWASTPAQDIIWIKVEKRIL